MPTPSLPLRPRLVFRAGFAGSQALLIDAELTAMPLPEDETGRQKESARRGQAARERQRLEGALPGVLDCLGHRLAALAPGVPIESGREPKVTAFFAPGPPLLRLVTGLCQGADAVAGRAIAKVQIPPDAGLACPWESGCLETELAAVLPFDVETYRRSRPGFFHGEFDRQLQQCAWVLTLDGHYEKPSPDTAAAQTRRNRAYRAQSAFLLRHSDVLIAAANPDASGGQAGGTLETVRNALDFALPVVFIHTGRDGDNVYLLEPEDDMHAVLAAPPPAAGQWRETLRAWVTQLTADPDNGLNPGDEAHDEARAAGEQMLREFFDDPHSPPCDATGKRQAGRRERAWNWLERRFRHGPEVQGDAALEPYATYRRRATDLNYHYTGQYRGAFVLNYLAAVIAVALAAVSLTLLGTAGNTQAVEPIAALMPTGGHVPAPAAPAPRLLPVLLILAALKLGIVIFISRNTRRANHGRWNDRAVNTRYLAERLRAMFYLPLAGSHQPPAAEPPQFASRAVRQSAVDWLCDSLVRAISPADLPHALPREFPATGEHGSLSVKKLIILKPAETARSIRDRWIAEQAKYHERSTRTMHALHHAIEKSAVFLSSAVILVVVVDLVLLAGKVFHLFPDPLLAVAKAATPWLIMTSAILPAIVAALGGLRFQSECQRIAERSAVMRVLLAGRAPHAAPPPRPSWWRRWWRAFLGFWPTAWLVLRRLCGSKAAPTSFQVHGGRWQTADAILTRISDGQATPATDPGAWSHDVLRLAERTATDFVQEVAEWSVLYTKEVSDPG